jgi:hypothetical protein
MSDQLHQHAWIVGVTSSSHVPCPRNVVVGRDVNDCHRRPIVQLRRSHIVPVQLPSMTGVRLATEAHDRFYKNPHP